MPYILVPQLFFDCVELSEKWLGATAPSLYFELALIGFLTIRSVYLPTIREGMPELIELFDGPDPNEVTGTRATTNVAGQSLYLINNRFVLEQSDFFANLLMKRFDSTKDRVNFAFLKAYGRPPNKSEMESTIAYFKKFLPAATRQTGDSKEAEWMFLTTFCQGLFSSAEFRYIN